MTNYNFIYSYTRELTEYSDESQNVYYLYNIENIKRVDPTNALVSLPKEIFFKIPNHNFIFYAGYNDDPSQVKVMLELELNAEEISLLDETVVNHKNNVPDKYGVWYQDAFVEDPGNPGNAYLFDTEEAAQQFIIDDELEGAIVKGVVVI